MIFETLDELVKARKGYKYLNKDRTSPYQGYKYVFRKRKIFKSQLDKNVSEDCGEGWNLATLGWIFENTNVLDKIIVEFSIPDNAEIIVPSGTSGKFRTNIIRYEKIHRVENLLPMLKDILRRLKFYKPINPITATILPPKRKIKSILKKVRAQIGAQVRAQIRAQVWIIVYYAIKLFMGLKYEHPAFDLIRLGIVVVRINDRLKIFGKNSKYLGEMQ